MKQSPSFNGGYNPDGAQNWIREEVIELLHEEGMKWMDIFALTLNGSQELPRLLARAKTVAGASSTPDEVHSLFDYYQHMVELMTHIIRNH